MPRQPHIDLDDPLSMAVVADWLLERGDPRGELIQLQLALEAEPGTHRLVTAEARHRAVHAKRLLGPLALQQSVVSFTWRRGYAVAAEVRSAARLEWRWWGSRTETDEVQPVNRLGRAVSLLARLPGAEHLVSMTLEQPWSRVLVPFLTEALAALRSIDLGLDRLSIVTPDDRGESLGESAVQACFTVDGLEVHCDERLAPLVKEAL